MNLRKCMLGIFAAGTALSLTSLDPVGRVEAHGDVAPQAVDTAGLPDLGEEWLAENPWRDPDSEFWALAIKVGASGYNQNCARCHGLEVISAGLRPICDISRPTTTATNGTWNAISTATHRTASPRCPPSETCSARRRHGPSGHMSRRDRMKARLIRIPTG